MANHFKCIYFCLHGAEQKYIFIYLFFILYVVIIMRQTFFPFSTYSVISKIFLGCHISYLATVKERLHTFACYVSEEAPSALPVTIQVPTVPIVGYLIPGDHNLPGLYMETQQRHNI